MVTVDRYDDVCRKLFKLLGDLAVAGESGTPEEIEQINEWMEVCMQYWEENPSNEPCETSPSEA